VTQNDYPFFPDALRSVVCGSVATLAIVEVCVGLTSGFIIAMLSEVVFGASPDERLRRALVIAAALATIGFAGLVLLRARVCA
jgi:hypothetical protein